MKARYHVAVFGLDEWRELEFPHYITDANGPPRQLCLPIISRGGFARLNLRLLGYEHDLAIYT